MLDVTLLIYTLILSAGASVMYMYPFLGLPTGRWFQNPRSINAGQTLKLVAIIITLVANPWWTALVVITVNVSAFHILTVIFGLHAQILSLLMVIGSIIGLAIHFA